MAIKKTKDIIDYARNFHDKLSKYYQFLADHTDKERIKLLLEYISRHEKHFEECLEVYEDTASERVLNSWLQNTPKLLELQTLFNFEMAEDTTTDDIINLAIRLDEKLIEIYKMLAHSAESEELRSVFQKLLEMEEREKIKLVRQSIRFNDL